ERAAFPSCGVPRSASPEPGCSTLMTSAPKSPSIVAPNGPAISEPISSTLMPASGSTPLTPSLLNLDRSRGRPSIGGVGLREPGLDPLQPGDFLVRVELAAPPLQLLRRQTVDVAV